MAFTIDKQIECIEREIKFRRGFYPKWVKEKRMTQEQADYQIACMEACKETIRGVRQAQSMTTMSGKTIA